MCGIAGFFSTDGKKTKDILISMVQSLVHRGPDAEGYFFESINQHQVALGHRRLSILDISVSANQPMEFEHLVISYNGEVYNFHKIKYELEKLGYSFLTNGDTEVILKAFHQWGLDCVHKFRGMFAFCIYDKRDKKAYLIRDRVGVKPLYYFYNGKTLMFASELRAFGYNPQFKKNICHRGLNLFLQYGYISAPHTIFENTFKVNPGHYLEYDLGRNSIEEKTYWNLENYYHKPKTTLGLESATTQLDALLHESFALRMVSDMPVGVLLSGGIDSSLVASILQSQSTSSIETFTIGFDQEEYDESCHARKIAQYIGANHNEKICTWKDAETILTELPSIYDEPFADSSLIPTVLLSKFTKNKVAVALSGDGGDELFCGYPSYVLSKKRFDKINNLPFKKVFSVFMKMLPDQYLNLYKYNFDGYSKYLKFKSIFSQDVLEEKYKAITRIFNLDDLRKLLIDQANYKLEFATLKNLDTFERMMLADFKHYLPDDLLVKVDRATMYYSLEGREPLLDHKILEFAAQLPIDYKFEKKILKKTLAKYLPLSYFDRVKQGFGVPIHLWLKTHLRYLTDQYLEPVSIKKQGLFNHKFIKNLYYAFLKSNTKDSRIWNLLVFQMWYEKNFNETF